MGSDRLAAVTKERLNPLLVGSSALYFLAALPLLFAPDELLRSAGAVPSVLDTALLQLLAAALFGFAMFNWLQRFTLTGGIYGRPVVIANFAHSSLAALSLTHFLRSGALPNLLLMALVAYTVLAVAFGWTFFRRLPAS